MNWVDMLIAISVLLGAVGGYRKGLFLSLSKVAGYILGFLGAYSFYRPFADILKSDLGMDSIIKDAISSLFNMPVSVSQVPIANLSIPKIQSALQAVGMPAMYKTNMQEALQQLGPLINETGVSTVGEALYYLISWAALEFLAFILLVFLIETAVGLIFKLVVKAIDITPAAFLDKWAGFVFGAAKSLVVVAIMLIAITPVVTLGTLNKEGSLGTLSRGIQQSQFSSYIVGLLK